ncbi:helix-turn-helix transcriptional regulator [Flectobacillus longus]|jgi:transcriptional regulator with XRE-family HTH domain|uniref:helix-turn-helix transcriptional regulator n=1 Tax=Flectobacillus longus TaxID=2984207 RepID=UPI0024B78D45|nr:helix-turn-helix domain-containing protein [Flectobacillus longus]MDI9882547.1 helix-turn-helix domain-containing protein [Flectobacillus longus]
MKQQDSIPDKIRKARVLKGLSQENVADMLGISTTAYGDIERGKTELSIKRAQDLSKVLDIPVLWEENELSVSPQIDTLLEENKYLKSENLRLEIELKFWKEKFEQQLYLEAYRILQQKQREPIGF